MTSDDGAIRNEFGWLYVGPVETAPLSQRVRGAVHREGLPIGGRPRRDSGSLRSRASIARRITVCRGSG